MQEIAECITDSEVLNLSNRKLGWPDVVFMAEMIQLKCAAGIRDEVAALEYVA